MARNILRRVVLDAGQANGARFKLAAFHHAELAKGVGGVPRQLSKAHPAVSRAVFSDLRKPLRGQGDRPAQVPPLEVLAPDGDLDEALHEVAFARGLFMPKVFPKLVALEEAARIEVVDGRLHEPPLLVDFHAAASAAEEINVAEGRGRAGRFRRAV
jgi:hypothetical protein